MNKFVLSLFLIFLLITLNGCKPKDMYIIWLDGEHDQVMQIDFIDGSILKNKCEVNDGCELIVDEYIDGNTVICKCHIGCETNDN